MLIMSDTLVNYMVTLSWQISNALIFSHIIGPRNAASQGAGVDPLGTWPGMLCTGN